MPTLTTPDLTKLERPKMEMPDFDFSKIDLSKIELPKMDVGKAVAGAATSVGLMERRRARWPFLLGAGLVVAAVGWAYMNAAMIRERLEDAAGWATEKFNGMYGQTPDDESVAFPAADPAGSVDYPNGFGAPADMASSTGDDFLALDEVTAKDKVASKS